MYIIVNGEQHHLASSMSLAQLLQIYELEPEKIAIEHNWTIIHAHQLNDVLISEGDRIEIIHFIGGG